MARIKLTDLPKPEKEDVAGFGLSSPTLQTGRLESNLSLVRSPSLLGGSLGLSKGGLTAFFDSGKGI
jgi:hypothetical protein